MYTFYHQRADKRRLKLRTERSLGSLIAESPLTEQANMRTHDSSGLPSLPNHNYLLI